MCESCSGFCLVSLEISLTSTSRRRESVIALSTLIALRTFNARLTLALAGMRIAILIFAAVRIACTRFTAELRVDVPVRACTAIARSADNVGATATLAGLLVANSVDGAADVAVAACEKRMRSEIII